jgi:hypothetical protein
MKSIGGFAIVVCLLFCAQARAQTLVYSLSYTDTAASRQARFANVSPAPGLRTEAENVAMLRNTRKNEIYSVSLADGKRSLLFSDDNMHLEIRAWGSVSGTAKAYTTGVWRERRATPTPGFYSDDGIYEIDLDGSNRFRKLADDQKKGRPALNLQGTKAAFVSWGDGKFTASIYAVPDWKLLAAWDFAKLVQTRCPTCVPASYGWMGDGNRLYVELVLGAADGDPAEKADHPGTYIFSGEGADLGTIPAETAAFEVPGYFHPEVDRHFLDQLPDGRYLFLDYRAKQGGSGKTETFLVISGPDAKLQKAIPMKFPFDGYISPSGRYLAYVEHRTTPDYRSELHLWVTDLQSGEEKELASTSPSNPPSSPEPNVTLSVLGWLN